MEYFSKFLDKFEMFIKRAVLPSVTFFVIFGIFFTVGLFVSENKITLDFFDFVVKVFFQVKIDYSVGIIFFIFLIGISYILSVMTQMCFDNFIKGNYSSQYNISNEKSDEALESLRDRVIEKIKKEDIFDENFKYNDYLLYQILGRKLSYFTNKTNTRKYIDETKAFGIVFLSIIISLFINLSLFFGFNGFIFALISSMFIYFIGFEVILAKYKSRALRIYVNFLIGEHK